MDHLSESNQTELRQSLTQFPHLIHYRHGQIDVIHHHIHLTTQHPAGKDPTIYVFSLP